VHLNPGPTHKKNNFIVLNVYILVFDDLVYFKKKLMGIPLDRPSVFKIGFNKK